MSNQSLQWVSIFAAALSAIFWLFAALIHIPAIDNRLIIGGDSVQGLGPVMNALRKQGRLSAIAAICAAIYTGIQAYIGFMY